MCDAPGITEVPGQVEKCGDCELREKKKIIKYKYVGQDFIVFGGS